MSALIWTPRIPSWPRWIRASPLVIADAQGRRLLPSVVYYPQRATASANSSPGHKDGHQKGYAKIGTDRAGTIARSAILFQPPLSMRFGIPFWKLHAFRQNRTAIPECFTSQGFSPANNPSFVFNTGEYNRERKTFTSTDFGCLASHQFCCRRGAKHRWCPGGKFFGVAIENSQYCSEIRAPGGNLNLFKPLLKISLPLFLIPFHQTGRIVCTNDVVVHKGIKKRRIVGGDDDLTRFSRGAALNSSARCSPRPERHGPRIHLPTDIAFERSF